MHRLWVRLILLLAVVCMQTGCLCWRNCPPEKDDVVQFHTGHGGSGE